MTNNNLRNSQDASRVVNANTTNAQQIRGDIWNLFFGEQLAPIGNPAREYNQRLLLADVKQEVESRLQQSLHNAVLVTSGIESQPQQLKRLWDAEVKIGSKPAELIPENTSILSVFDSEEIAGRLLISGMPGSGKTTTLLELTQSLIQRAEEQPDYPIPVLFNLSSWKGERQPLIHWLITELKFKYGVSVKLGKKWLENRLLIPLLDGLDEVESNRQEPCVNAINQLLEREFCPQSLVVCSRSEESDNYTNNLALNGAIYLKLLTNNQIHNYLVEVNHADLWETINRDSDLLDLVKTPLLLNVAVLAASEISIERWQQLTSTESRIQYLLNAYVLQMLTRDIHSRICKKKAPHSQQTQLWLIWLAQQLKRTTQKEFLIEGLQPFWLKNRAQKTYKLILRTTVVLSFALIIGVFDAWQNHDWILALIIGLGNGLIKNLFFELIFRRYREIKPVEIFKFSSKKAQSWLKWGLFIGLIFGLVMGVLVGLRDGLIIGIISGLFGELFFGLGMGVIFGLIIGQISPAIETKKIPNQGIWFSAVNAVILGLILGWFLWFIGGLFNRYSLISWLYYEVYYGFFGGLIFGGVACIQHFTLRLILHSNGYSPWNYARFLNYCTERSFLQRVGGRYCFIHKMLQDHFAQMELEVKHPK
ncbi:hypothetical protein WA1_45455 [Scytonema hofmannii PCC 7110]|uniref:NACHT domain-containing protein n=1 Tax=Scytonema hofmannii PCC 7110 TaxID=128403 RepID=A0A139WWU5_9CYAN|nr:NACHT domain-containing protein [Scytonema hofmannii]KYC36908.1 hypothetical protein WA1_45455 [Scytonema hofmannii PCC 7110]